MAKIIVHVHEYDHFTRRGPLWRPVLGNYLLFGVLCRMGHRGHVWQVVAGPVPVPGDIAILHVDRTRVEAEYLALATQYARTVNFAAADISKRRVSGALLSHCDAWTGPVIVKTDLNFAGRPEALHNHRALLAGHAAPNPGLAAPADYRVLASLTEVDSTVWNDPALVVERFIPETDERGYATRSWVFMGERERCSRHVARDPMVKATNSIGRTAVPVPHALRAERRRLGFEFGKFDFVMHEGRPVLLDANRTPGPPPGSGARLRAQADVLADGLDRLIRARRE